MKVAKILCVTDDAVVLETRCAVLKYSGYDACSVLPRGAGIALRGQKFDLVVISSLSDSDLHRVVNFSDGAKLLVFDGFIAPAELLSLVAERLRYPADRIIDETCLLLGYHELREGTNVLADPFDKNTGVERLG
jgi:hypothetical protein